MAYGRKKGGGKSSGTDWSNFIIEEDSDSFGSGDVDIKRIITWLLFQIATFYNNRLYGQFKNAVDSLKAIMIPMIDYEELESNTDEWNKEMEETISKKMEESGRPQANALREQLEVQYYYKLWIYLNTRIKKGGMGYIEDLTLPA